MEDANRQGYFEAKDIDKLLNIDKDRLNHWVNIRKLIVPDIERGKGRGGRNKFSFKNLLDLSLIKDLFELKIDFDQIEYIINKKAPLYDPEEEAPAVDDDKMEFIKTDIWESYSSNRPTFDRDGYILVIAKGKDEDEVFVTNEKKFFKTLYEESGKNNQIRSIMKPITIIDLLSKIRGLEQKTGYKFDYYSGYMKAIKEYQESLDLNKKKK